MEQELIVRRTQWGYAATRVLDTPFWGIFNMLPFILYKDLHASPFQLAILIALKPLVAIFSSYWSTWIHKNPNSSIKKIILLRFLSLLPFLFPFFSSPWYWIAAFGIYTMTAFGILPTWMELLKTNVPQLHREKLFSYTQAFGYLGGGLLPFALGTLLDDNDQAWRWIFPLAASVSLCSTYFQIRILVEPPPLPNTLEKKPFLYHLMVPWKSAWKLLLQRPDFRRYQLGFMLIGSGLMIIQPALPIYFVDNLNLSYTEVAVALTLCKGIGFALGSPIWSRWINQIDIFKFSSCIASLACLFPLMLFLTKFQLSWLYLGYFIYGFMQSGNELSWNMSGPIFSKERTSTLFTAMNTMAIGFRGAFIPALGGLIITAWGPQAVLFCGFILCAGAVLGLSLSCWSIDRSYNRTQS